jgi:cytochrome c-type biogenesis protein
VITGLLARITGDVGPWGNYLVAAVFVIVGLHLLDLIPLPFLGQAGQPAFRKKGLIAAFLLGLIFGVALGPCTFAFMAPVLGAVFSLGASNLPMAAGLVLTTRSDMFRSLSLQELLPKWCSDIWIGTKNPKVQ